MENKFIQGALADKTLLVVSSVIIWTNDNVVDRCIYTHQRVVTLSYMYHHQHWLTFSANTV